jgi:hypothetical protein
MPVRYRTTRTTLALAAVTALTLVGCGAPEFAYVKNSEHKTYFKVPSSWGQVDQGALDSYVNGEAGSAQSRVNQETIWSVAYDAAQPPEVDHIFGFATTDEPVVWAKVEELQPQQADVVSNDVLRNLVLPVTPDARQASAANGSMMSDFELLHDEVLNPEKGLRGVRVVFNYGLPAGGLHTFDQTVLIDDAGTALYLLLLRCSATCYVDRLDEIQEVQSSFTVRSS